VTSLAVGWVRFFAPESPTAKLAALRETIAGLERDMACLEQENKATRANLERSTREADNWRDLVEDIRKLLDRELK
jgi:hypothetical protein